MSVALRERKTKKLEIKSVFITQSLQSADTQSSGATTSASTARVPRGFPSVNVRIGMVMTLETPAVGWRGKHKETDEQAGRMTKRETWRSGRQSGCFTQQLLPSGTAGSLISRLHK